MSSTNLENLKDVFTTMRSEIANAQHDLIEVRGLRARMDALALGLQFKNPQSLSSDDLILRLVKQMTLERLVGASLARYDNLCSSLPALKAFRDALYAEAIVQNVQVSPDPCVITDSRLSVEEFVKVLPDQVFKRRVD